MTKNDSVSLDAESQGKFVGSDIHIGLEYRPLVDELQEEQGRAVYRPLPTRYLRSRNAIVNIGRNKDRFRAAAYAPLVAAVLAGTICAGTGIGTAAPTAAAIVTVPPPIQNMWQLINTTDTPIYGNWAQQRAGDSSEIIRGIWGPLKPGESASAAQVKMTFGRYEYWWAHVCYNHMWRNLNGGVAGQYETDYAELEKTATGGLAVEFFHGDLHERNGRVVLEDNPAEGDCGV
ncbi:hypothetical protein R3Q06_33280 [Rhodococcus erythropolis]|uniref:hypothetical protein n=1 Tax=Rhodococcus erythropolis TaxID=1833 RepID=UPI0029497422|nr:hypothetical protein [Rhodococcus erythropolis]MDV6278317.1 hypothetical protein [Rhodococcus erythropolis]